MVIKRSLNDPYFLEKSRYLGNCYVIYDENMVYHYEFIINRNEATIISDTSLYYTELIDFFRQDNAFITVFKTKDGSFYKAFDPVFTFKLPLSILQVSTMFLNQNRIQELKPYFNPNDTVIPVTILDEEYVILDGHHRVYLAYEEGMKMVDVYLDEKSPQIEEFLYLAKEQNMKHIKDLSILSNQEYTDLWIAFKEKFFTTHK
ncbi:MAG: hypothetical protein K2P14_02245 [Anaeroplasmataceae bacterium]|nr:hypothetical protein [Anaeroplasmataceae bacterium]